MPIESNRAHTLHEALLDAIREKRRTDRQMALLLTELAEGRHYQARGHATLVDYSLAALGLTRRQVNDLIKVGRRLPEPPILDSALAEGRIDFTKARELMRVITPATEPTWVARCETVTNRELERMISGVQPGDPPPDVIPAPELLPARRRFVFELESTDAEALIAALAAIRAEADALGDEIDDSVALATLARQGSPCATPRSARPRPRAVLRAGVQLASMAAHSSSEPSRWRRESCPRQPGDPVRIPPPSAV